MADRLIPENPLPRRTNKNRLVEINGESRCVSEWCEIYGLNYQRVYNRRGKGPNKRPVEDVLREEIAKVGKYK